MTTTSTRNPTATANQQPTKLPTNWPASQSTNQLAANQLTNQPSKQPTKQAKTLPTTPLRIIWAPVPTGLTHGTDFYAWPWYCLQVAPRPSQRFQEWALAQDGYLENVFI